MSELTNPAPPPRSWIQRHLWHLVAAGLLLVIALMPAEVSWLFAIGDGILLWVLFSIPLCKTMVGESTGFQRFLFGAMALTLGAVGAAFLVGLACMGPVSRVNLH